MVLDVLSPESIQQCVSSVKAQYGAHDMLINNPGRGYSMPLSDASLNESRQFFELNVCSVLAVARAFLPILLKANHGAMIVNNTSISSVVPNPMGGRVLSRFFSLLYYSPASPGLSLVPCIRPA